MAVPHNSSAAEEESDRPAEAPAPSAASPSNIAESSGVRILNARVYDPNCKSCHQCRQKTTDFTARCRQIRRNKPCPIKFCRKCLLNRYGEQADAVALLDNWICPKCRGVCNCSFCMKKKGHQPTGILIHTAKATGCSSVHEFLDKQGSDVLNAASGLRSLSMSNADIKAKYDDSVPTDCTDGVKPNETVVSGKESNDDIQDKHYKVHKDEQDKKVKVKRKSRRKNTNIHIDNLAIVVPQGTPLTEVAGAEWQAEDVGPTLQFLEFCNSFSEVLDINKGEPESVLRELARGCVGRRGLYSSIVKFHAKLLSFIQKDMGEKSIPPSITSGDQWLESVIKCMTESEYVFKVPLDALEKGSLEYDSWDPSEKLRLLNLLCDRTLETGEIRSWIDDVNKKNIEKRKEARETTIAAKKKEKDIKKTLKDDTAKAMLSLSGGPDAFVADHNNLVSQISIEKERAHAEMLEIMEQLPKETDNPRRDGMRTEPVLLEGDGHVYWKLGGVSGKLKIMHQDIGSWDAVIPEDKWFAYDEDEEKTVEKYLSTLRKRKRKEHRSFLRQRTDGLDSISYDDHGNNATSPNCSVEGDSGTRRSTSDQESQQMPITVSNHETQQHEQIPTTDQETPQTPTRASVQEAQL